MYVKDHNWHLLNIVYSDLFQYYMREHLDFHVFPNICHI